MKLLLLSLGLCACASAFPQIQTPKLYWKSVEVELSRCLCNTLVFLPQDEKLGPFSLLPKEKVFIADSSFWSKQKNDTSFRVYELLPLELRDNYVNVQIDMHIVEIKDGVKSREFGIRNIYSFTFDCISKEYELSNLSADMFPPKKNKSKIYF